MTMNVVRFYNDGSTEMLEIFLDKPYTGDITLAVTEARHAHEMTKAIRSFVDGIEDAMKRDDPIVDRLNFHYTRMKTILTEMEREG
jgi:hypothetical protein